MSRSMLTRLQRLGVLSVTALFLGGLILIFTGTNGLLGPSGVKRGTPVDVAQKAFRYGSSLSSQAWLAIFGVGFALSSYGFNEAYMHLFDWWCSRQAQRNGGLNYGLYLNSQPRAPILYGRRGFTGFITLRYLLALATISASIGYKFGVVEVTIPLADTVELSRLFYGLLSPDADDLKASIKLEGSVPWLTDSSENVRNRGFFHELQQEAFRPPVSVIMVGQLTCVSSLLYTEDQTTLYTREAVMVANMTEEKGSFTMTEESGDWRRAISRGRDWFSPSHFGALVDYRIVEDGEVQIKWTKIGPWLTQSREWSKAAARLLRYRFHYAVAEVKRTALGGDCSLLRSHKSIQILSRADKPAVKNLPGFYDIGLDDEWIWVDAMLRGAGSTESGISDIIRFTMTRYAKAVDPFGPEDPTSPPSYLNANERKRFQYPFLDSFQWKATGSEKPAAIVFVILGCFTVLVGIVRVWVGPPVLTSWMAQHVFLAQSGAITIPVMQDDLAIGYSAASVGLGRLRLPENNT